MFHSTVYCRPFTVTTLSNGSSVRKMALNSYAPPCQELVSGRAKVKVVAMALVLVSATIEGWVPLEAAVDLRTRTGLLLLMRWVYRASSSSVLQSMAEVSRRSRPSG